ncbi:MAG: 2-oxo acid dehydrogenase subunit E2, partial [candidate division NC10 bacterium]|nr:2-oxo acid dehydrogenase subunit E2 [candidate division NC10 bacterium]
AEHMVRSKRTSPHVTTVMEADMSKVVAFRDRQKDEFQKREGFPLTYLPFFVQAAVAALRAFPMVNTTFAEDKIVLKKRINVGIAVATEQGLIVPVIKDADEKSLLRLAREAYDLATRAREGKLSPDDVAGGTFTITNHGVSGSLLSTPIIHQPQVGILGTGAVTKRVVVRDDAIAIRPMIYLSLSFDHRAFDGAVADRFLARIKEHLEAGGLSL